ncbi:hypothetical protein OAU50_02645 [Planctomycetota bacterium]|nr:hypothetical protein [Planctomycetota bacterium]
MRILLLSLATLVCFVVEGGLAAVVIEAKDDDSIEVFLPSEEVLPGHFWTCGENGETLGEDNRQLLRGKQKMKSDEYLYFNALTWCDLSKLNLLSKVPQISKVLLQNGTMTSEQISVMKDWKSLRYLHVRCNATNNSIDPSEIVDGLGELTQLTELRIQSSNLSSNELAPISKLVNLARLTIGFGNYLYSKSPTYKSDDPAVNLTGLKALTKLEKLTMFANSSGYSEDFEFLTGLPKLRRFIGVDLKGESLWPSLGQINNLNHLELVGCPSPKTKELATVLAERDFRVLGFRNMSLLLRGSELLTLGSVRDLTLTSVSLSQEQLSAVFDHLSSVEFLELDCSITKDLLGSVCKLTKLLNLSWKAKPAADVDWAGLRKLKKLTNLTLTANCDLAMSKGLASLSKLVVLNMGDLPYTRRTLMACMKELAKMKSLKYLYTQQSFGDDVLVALIAKLKKLEFLDLGSCSSLTDNGIKSLIGLKNLKTLVMSNAGRVTSDGLCQLYKLKKMVALKIVGTPAVDDNFLKGIASWKNLELLNLNSCSGFSDKGLLSISEQKTIRTLYLTGSKGFTEFGLEHLSELPVLERITLGAYHIMPEARKKVIDGLPNVIFEDHQGESRR